MKMRNFFYCAVLLFGLLRLTGCDKYSNHTNIHNEELYDEYDDGYDDAYDRIAPQFIDDSYYMEGYRDGKKDLNKFGY